MRNDRNNQRSPFQVSNPAFREEAYDHQAMVGEETATVTGAIGKTGILLSIVIGMAGIGWAVNNAALSILCIVVSIGLGFWIAARPQKAMPLSLTYAVTQGFAVGFISRILNEMISTSENSRSLLFRGAIPIAMGGTLLVTGVMLGLYRAQIIRVTETFKSVVIGSTIAIAILYMVTLFGGMIFPSMFRLPIYQPTIIGIVFSVFVIALAAMNLVLDFHWIEKAQENRCAKYMEWYTGWGLTVTIVWLYIEILRLLSKLANRR